MTERMMATRREIQRRFDHVQFDVHDDIHDGIHHEEVEALSAGELTLSSGVGLFENDGKYVIWKTTILFSCTVSQY